MHGELQTPCQAPGEKVGGGDLLFMVTMTLFPVEEMVGELEHTAGNEETSAGRSFQSTVNCGTATHTEMHTRTRTATKCFVHLSSGKQQEDN